MPSSRRDGVLVRRSMITGAANNPRHVETAWSAGADSIMLDLEDALPPTEKERGRLALESSVAAVARGGSDVIVRVNNGPELDEDLDAAAIPGVDTVLVPKVECGETIQDVDEKLSALEITRSIAPGSIGIGVVIENVIGLSRINDILAASPRILTVTLGTEDFTHDIGAEPTAIGDEVLLPQLQVVLAARLAEVTPVFGVLGSLSGVRDLDAVERRALWARSVGFRGSACSARDHVAIARLAFSPDPEASAKARRIIDAYAEALSRGDGRVVVEGGIVDVPVVLRAERLLAWDEAVRAMDARLVRGGGLDHLSRRNAPRT